MSIGAPSYYVVQSALRTMTQSGLVARRARSGQHSYFGLTDKGLWIADILSQLDELAIV